MKDKYGIRFHGDDHGNEKSTIEDKEKLLKQDNLEKVDSPTQKKSQTIFRGNSCSIFLNGVEVAKAENVRITPWEPDTPWLKGIGYNDKRKRREP